MDQYLSTYSKDYVWPPAKRSAPTAGRDVSFCDEGPCICGAEPGGYMPPREYGATQVGENYQWSRLDPMGPLLDPKLYPAKMGPGPECDVTRYDQPDTYMRKLQEKYPYIYNVLRGPPSEDVIQLVNEDRLRTTYQVDYGHIDEHPTASYDNSPREARFSPDCSKNVPLDCRAHVRPPDYGDRGEEHRAKNGYGTSGGVGSGSNGSGGVGSGSNGSGGVGSGSNGSGGPREATSYGRGGNGYAAASGGAGGASGGFGGAREAAPRATGSNGRAATSGGAGNGSTAPRGGAANGAGGAKAAQGGRNLAVKAMRSSAGGTGKKSDGGADGERGKRGDSEAANKPLPAWTSEYNEVIGQTGLDIVRDKLHQHGGKSPGRVFTERAVMRCRDHT